VAFYRDEGPAAEFGVMRTFRRIRPSN